MLGLGLVAASGHTARSWGTLHAGGCPGDSQTARAGPVLPLMVGLGGLGLLFVSHCVCLLYWDAISQLSMVFVKITSKKSKQNGRNDVSSTALDESLLWLLAPSVPPGPWPGLGLARGQADRLRVLQTCRRAVGSVLVPMGAARAGRSRTDTPSRGWALLEASRRALGAALVSPHGVNSMSVSLLNGRWLNGAWFVVCNCRGSCTNDNFVMKGSSGDKNFSKQPKHLLSDLCSEHVVIAGRGTFPKENVPMHTSHPACCW